MAQVSLKGMDKLQSVFISLIGIQLGIRRDEGPSPIQLSSYDVAMQIGYELHLAVDR